MHGNGRRKGGITDAELDEMLCVDRKFSAANEIRVSEDLMQRTLAAAGAGRMLRTPCRKEDLEADISRAERIRRTRRMAGAAAAVLMLAGAGAGYGLLLSGRGADNSTSETVRDTAAAAEEERAEQELGPDGSGEPETVTETAAASGSFGLAEAADWLRQAKDVYAALPDGGDGILLSENQVLSLSEALDAQRVGELERYEEETAYVITAVSGTGKMTLRIGTGEETSVTDAQGEETCFRMENGKELLELLDSFLRQAGE